MIDDVWRQHLWPYSLIFWIIIRISKLSTYYYTDQKIYIKKISFLLQRIYFLAWCVTFREHSSQGCSRNEMNTLLQLNVLNAMNEHAYSECLGPVQNLKHTFLTKLYNSLWGSLIMNISLSLFDMNEYRCSFYCVSSTYHVLLASTGCAAYHEQSCCTDLVFSPTGGWILHFLFRFQFVRFRYREDKITVCLHRNK